MQSYKHEIVPFKIDISGKLNGEDIEIMGTGVVPTIGVYKAMLAFNKIPKNFHPTAISTYIVSICCYSHGAMRNGGMNIKAMGADGYKTKRVLGFPTGQITIEGDVNIVSDGTYFKGAISGSADIPTDLSGSSTYLKRIEPVDSNTLLGVGEGSLFKNDGKEVPVNIQTIHELRPAKLANPLKDKQFRIVSESGVLLGNCYSTKVYSILDGKNTMEKVLIQPQSLIKA